MKILSAEQIKVVDQYTIANEPISSIDLMERAALGCIKRLIKLINIDAPVYIICGKGNNGGDGMAIGRLLYERGFDAKAIVINDNNKFSNDSQINYELFKTRFPENIKDVQTIEELKQHTPDKSAVIIDAIFGSGLNKPVEGFTAQVIQYINQNFRKIISIDVPSGLYIDQSSKENQNIIHSTLTLSLQLPKLAFLLAENKNFVPEFELINIGLSEAGISEHGTNYFYITNQFISSLLKKRNKFDHKGTFGHALLMAGSNGKSGAAIISAKACLRSGAGLLTVHSNKETLQALLQQLPEAMSDADAESDHISEIERLENYDAVAFGPGVGTHEDTQRTLKKLLNYYKGNIVIDADGLNILSENKTWLEFLPANTILTPHPKEFERLAGKSENDFERLKDLKNFALKYKCIVILKGAHSATAMPDGNILFNSSGNAGLAKGGSGDGLTGIILGLLARGYNAPQSALIATFIHGYAADLCAKKMSQESILISDVIDRLSKAFQKLE